MMILFDLRSGECYTTLHLIVFEGNNAFYIKTNLTLHVPELSLLSDTVPGLWSEWRTRRLRTAPSMCRPSVSQYRSWPRRNTLRPGEANSCASSTFRAKAAKDTCLRHSSCLFLKWKVEIKQFVNFNLLCIIELEIVHRKTNMLNNTFWELCVFDCLFNEHVDWFDQAPGFPQSSESVPDVDQLKGGKDQSVALIQKFCTFFIIKC